MPHRVQAYSELCRACKEPARLRCPDCSVPICERHERCPPCHRVWLVVPPAVVRPRAAVKRAMLARAMFGSMSGAVAVAVTWLGLGAGAAAGVGAACAFGWLQRNRGGGRPLLGP